MNNKTHISESGRSHLQVHCAIPVREVVAWVIDGFLDDITDELLEQLRIAVEDEQYLRRKGVR